VAAVAEKFEGKPDGKADGFLGRWARRKNDALQGKPLDEPAPVVPPAPLPVAVANAAAVPQASPATEETPEPVRELSLDDAKLLTKDSDFKPFMASNVGPDVRNAAMKKLFADPHFNVMDGLDIYVDDYSISEPIPESMLRQMTSAKFLKLFDDEEDDDKAKAAAEKPDNPDSAEVASRENANGPNEDVVAHSDELPQTAPSSVDSASSLPASLHSSQPELLADSGASPYEHDHTDLRLQPDDAAPGPEAGRRT
jgi:Protein of unknown function (DUF3306)